MRKFFTALMILVCVIYVFPLVVAASGAEPELVEIMDLSTPSGDYVGKTVRVRGEFGYVIKEEALYKILYLSDNIDNRVRMFISGNLPKEQFRLIRKMKAGSKLEVIGELDNDYSLIVTSFRELGMWN